MILLSNRILRTCMNSFINREVFVSERSLMIPLLLGAGEIRKTSSCCFEFFLGAFCCFLNFFLLSVLIIKMLGDFKGTDSG